MRMVEIVLHNIILKNFKENKIKLFWTQIQTLNPSDPKDLSLGLKFSDPTDLGPDLGPIKNLGSESGSSWTQPRSDPHSSLEGSIM